VRAAAEQARAANPGCWCSLDSRRTSRPIRRCCSRRGSRCSASWMGTTRTYRTVGGLRRRWGSCRRWQRSCDLRSLRLVDTRSEGASCSRGDDSELRLYSASYQSLPFAAVREGRLELPRPLGHRVLRLLAPRTRSRSTCRPVSCGVVRCLGCRPSRAGREQRRQGRYPRVGSLPGTGVSGQGRP
jgi:hypothetical protein